MQTNDAARTATPRILKPHEASPALVGRWVIHGIQNLEIKSGKIGFVPFDPGVSPLIVETIYSESLIGVRTDGYFDGRDIRSAVRSAIDCGQKVSGRYLLEEGRPPVVEILFGIELINHTGEMSQDKLDAFLDLIAEQGEGNQGKTWLDESSRGHKARLVWRIPDSERPIHANPSPIEFYLEGNCLHVKFSH